MKKKNIIALILGMLVIGIIVIVLLFKFVFTLTSGIVETADSFFKAVEQQDYSKAYGYLSEDFQYSISEDNFKSFLESSALVNYAGAEWDSRSISNGEGTLEGSVKTKSGGVIPIKLKLVKENDEWKIYSIQKPDTGIVSEGSTAIKIPDEEKRIKLVKDSMHDFALAVNAKDFTEFHKHISKNFQDQFSPEKLFEIFKSFSEQNIDLTVLDPLQPLFDEAPQIDEQGILILVGHYATTPNVTYFKLKYYERPNWKLMGINVDIK